MFYHEAQYHIEEYIIVNSVSAISYIGYTIVFELDFQLIMSYILFREFT